MDPRDFLEFAKNTLNNKKPASFRTAISRAYYSSYNVGSENLSSLGFTIPKTAKGHETVRQFLHNCGEVQLEKASTRLNNLRTIRNTSDYNMGSTRVETEIEALAAIRDAEKIISDLDQCFNGNNRESIKRSIEDYLSKTNQ